MAQPTVVAGCLVGVMLVVATGKVASSADSSADPRDTPEVREVATLLGLAPSHQRPAQPAPAPDPSASAALLAQEIARSEILARIVLASEQADQAIASISEEQAQILEVQSWIIAKQGAYTTRLNTAVAILAGGAAVGTGLTIFDRTARAGAIVGTVAGVIGAGAAVVASRSSALARPPIPVTVTMLGPFLAGAAPSAYPTLVWRFLTERPPGASVSRKDRLLAAWRLLGRLPSPTTSEGRTRIAGLAGPLGRDQAVDADVLSDRLRMLADVRAQISSLKSALAQILARERAQQPDAPARQ
jgi:hypothetical protein